MRVLGIMSGTSIDAVDYVVCSISRAGAVSLDDHWQVPFPRVLRQRLLRAAENELTTYQLGQLHHDLGRFYARGAAGASVQLAGLHGQTVFHAPGPRSATLQIGESAYLAEELRVPVVSNFRAADLAAGGQGAPLASIFHVHAFAAKGRHIAVNNLGGISNVTSIDWRTGPKPRILSFDTGPANILIDLAVQQVTGGRQKFDRNGKLAARGKVDRSSVDRWLKDPYLASPPPKSTGREHFGIRYLQARAKKLTGEDLIATLTEFTARSIEFSYRLHLESPPGRVILCGGGARNPVLRARIQAALGETEVLASGDLGWPSEVIEGAAFALLAWLRWHEKPGNIPTTTGARRACLLGQVAR